MLCEASKTSSTLYGMTANPNPHRLIFCINSGRSGSKYLSKVLGSAKEVMGFHEADPKMIGEYLTLVNNQPYDETFITRKLKANAILEIISGFSDETVYCETNHMFIKTFFDVVLDEFPTCVDVIVLRRKLSYVLKSFLELGYFSDQNSAWPNWMSSPNAVTAAIPCVDRDENLDQCDRCIAYLIDIEARALRFCQDYPHVKVHPVRLESFSSFEFVERLFSTLNLTPTSRTKKVFQKTFNAKEQRKQSINQSVDIQYCQDRINSYIQRATAMGIKVPDSLAIE
jgi:hypothetical protein